MSFEAMKFGPLGDAVADAMPHTEADPVGVLAAALSLFSAAINGKVSMTGTGRPIVVWTALVGRSAFGGKGAALKAAGASLAPSIGSFLDLRTRSGVSSGPSLVNMLYEWEQDTIASEQGADGRGLIVEQEWAGPLKRARSCKTFSQNLRLAWDGERVSNKTKVAYEVVDRPLLGFHAHITPGEWNKYLSASDALGGTYNRILPVLVKLSKVLPYSHVPKFVETEELTAAYQWACAKPRRMQLTPEAGERWDELRALIIERMERTPENVSCYMERSAEQVIRVAATLTAAQKKTKVSVAAIDAAWAFVQYSMTSVEKLVSESESATTSVKNVKPLPEIIREVLTRYGGEASSTLMLRALGTRTNAAGLKATVAEMDDVEAVKGDGSRNPGTKYRFVPEDDPASEGGKASAADVSAELMPARAVRLSVLDSPAPTVDKAIPSPRKAPKARRPAKAMADLI